MAVALRILPIFLVIGLGFWGARREFFPPGFVQPANRLVFYIAVPALIFRSLALSPVSHSFLPLASTLAVAAMVIAWLLSIAVSRLFFPGSGDDQPSRASWVQCTIHGNQAMMGLAVILYGLGETGLAAAGMVTSAVILAQNVLSVITLTRWGSGGQGGSSLLRAVGLNPIILSSLAGLGWAVAGLELPVVADHTLRILGGMGLPLALLIIGATLSGGRLGGGVLMLLTNAGMKLMVMPAIGLGLLTLAGETPVATAVTVILLSSPSATISVIMAGQMGGDSKLASAVVSAASALSAITYWVWLSVVAA